jgi:hypothetical protein
VTIEATSAARDYSPDKVRNRYVQAPGAGEVNGWRWCEVGDDRRYDLRQGTCPPSDLPAEVMNAALDRRIAGVWPFYVDWPL